MLHQNIFTYMYLYRTIIFQQLFMIQRIQSIYLLLFVLSCAALYALPLCTATEGATCTFFPSPTFRFFRTMHSLKPHLCRSTVFIMQLLLFWGLYAYSCFATANCNCACAAYSFWLPSYLFFLYFDSPMVLLPMSNPFIMQACICW